MVRELDVLGSDNMKKYEITWSAIDWCTGQISSEIVRKEQQKDIVIKGAVLSEVEDGTNN